MEGDDRPQWPRKVAALVNGRIRGKEILLSLRRRARRDKAQCLHSFSVPVVPPAPSALRDHPSAKGVRTYSLLPFLTPFSNKEVLHARRSSLSAAAPTVGLILVMSIG